MTKKEDLISDLESGMLPGVPRQEVALPSTSSFDSGLRTSIASSTGTRSNSMDQSTAVEDEDASCTQQLATTSAEERSLQTESIDNQKSISQRAVSDDTIPKRRRLQSTPIPQTTRAQDSAIHLRSLSEFWRTGPSSSPKQFHLAINRNQEARAAKRESVAGLEPETTIIELADDVALPTSDSMRSSKIKAVDSPTGASLRSSLASTTPAIPPTPSSSQYTVPRILDSPGNISCALEFPSVHLPLSADDSTRTKGSDDSTATTPTSGGTKDSNSNFPPTPPVHLSHTVPRCAAPGRQKVYLLQPRSPPPSRVPDRPSEERADKTTGAPIRLKGSLKVPRNPNDPPFTLKIPIVEDPNRTSIKWSNCREYFYDTFTYKRSHSWTRKCFSPLFCMCCTLPTLLVMFLYFLLWYPTMDDYEVAR